MQAATDTPVDIIIVIQGLIIAFVAAPALVSAIWRVKPRAPAPAVQRRVGGVVTTLVVAAEAVSSSGHRRPRQGRASKGRALCIVAAVLGVAAIALFSRAEGDATYVLSPRGGELLDFAVPAGPTAFVLGLIAIALGVVGAVRARPSRAPIILASRWRCSWRPC